MTIKQINELISRLEELIDWGEENIWEIPIDLPDSLELAIKGLKELKQWKRTKTLRVDVAPEEIREAFGLEG